ncbi:hypothetical protein Xcel_3468 (plasmid) [Xylanimonas cellulosilytica DSM 15894]|uniref:Secreted protein n=1 Tax=Xylanimonas cellulosilytica (strain DSM 15894 / JCM 12276 / CECT 5975 / KCTC 9989 / LMG 20990 / NBRC 107835 / XIL07) TaxID=446471 RepID=D1C101_XYLCX|nr:hypothetical protein [Xylanimonas cellulosilytica]ACZ32467.1 hypothetical protein Xcel_3468 [Xylanimonas cellulosilytica DSM 15894]
MRLMHRPKMLTAVASLAVGLSTLALGVQSAAASEAPGNDSVTTTMVATGYDADVAAAHGYRIEVQPDGTPVAIPVSDEAKAAEAAAITPFTTVGGNCGTSSVVILDAGGGKAAVSTGFNLIRGAVSYGWQVNVTGFAGGYTKNFGGVIANHSTWQGSFTWTVPTSGTYIAKVAESSWALMNNGVICTSAGPVDSEYVYR